MAAIDYTRTSAASTNSIANVGAFLRSAVATVATWNDARVTRNSLATLTDRELEDIGLSRGDIDSVALSTSRY